MSDTELGPSEIPEEPKADEEVKQKLVLIELNRRKRASKRSTTKARHHLEKLIVEKAEKDFESHKLVMQESNELEGDCQKVIEKTQAVIVKCASESCVLSPPIQKTAPNTGGEAETEVTDNQGVSTSVTGNEDELDIADDVTNQGSQAVAPATLGGNDHLQQPVTENSSSTSTGYPSPQHDVTTTSSGHGETVINRRLKPLRVPTFDGDKKKFEEFWGLFVSLVDMSNEPTSLKMARLRQSLTGIALDSIRGLGVSGPEYKEAKEILNTKFGGQRRQLRAYLDDLERMHPLRAADVQGFERFADLVRVTVVKLQAEGKVGELGDGTLYSLLVKKLTGHQLEIYTRWMNEHSKDRSVLSLRDWLKEEVSIRVEAIEMAHGIESEDSARYNRKQYPTKGGRSNPSSFFMASNNQRNSAFNKDKSPKQKPPCAFCNGPYHGIWACRQFEQRSVEQRWNFAKEKQLCFRCLSFRIDLSLNLAEETPRTRCIGKSLIVDKELSVESPSSDCDQWSCIVVNAC
ncbi:Hypothetical predicted protein [Paramuricea clavata]|uniref:Uncharacterized protein n=1 Tax=Paramuricea clavata TaxID=317549 RepID=A0A7D9HZ51_PARCT|nr:Hypothetical predicted protein [Paramuricea clavata]